MADHSDLASLFCDDYQADRASFERAVTGFAARAGRSLQLHKHTLDGHSDLHVTAAELPARRPQRLLVLVTGIHGVEGYTGSAAVRLLMSELLLRLNAEDTALFVVHALNPYGFAHFMRVNQHNVDLNRNCAQSDDELLHHDDSAYTALAQVLSPARPLRVGPLAHARFLLRMLAARTRLGETAVRQATLGGQYAHAPGIFWGGDRVQPELRFFQRHFERLAAQYPEQLVIDLHTGYGERGQAYALFGRADTPSIAACTLLGVRSTSGHEATYHVFGDLVQYCYDTAKRLQPAGVFDGLALELGTHGLTTLQQLQDLYSVVQENQLRHHGVFGSDAGLENEQQVRGAFRELFYPSDANWRALVLRNCLRAVENLLTARSFV